VPETNRPKADGGWVSGGEIFKLGHVHPVEKRQHDKIILRTLAKKSEVAIGKSLGIK
jgi:hypothetical protein